VAWAGGLSAIAIWGVHDGKARAFDPDGLTRPFGPLGDLLVAPAARWDATWFLAIARDGYVPDPDRAAFFPLYPGLVALLSPLTGALLGAIVLSLACFLVGLAAFHRLAVLEIGPAGARWAVAGMALFPGSLWFSSAYSEALFLAVSVGAVLCAREQRWGAAGMLGALAAATRSAGVLLVVPLALLWLEARRSGRAQPADGVWIAMVPVGLLAYCTYLAAVGVGFTAPFDAQETWHRTFAGPWAGPVDGAVAAWHGLRQLLHGSPEPVFFTAAGGDPMEVARHNIMLFAFLVLALVALVGALRRLPAAHGAYALVALLLPLSYPVAPQPLMSLPRFLAVLYPLFLWLGWWLARGGALRRRVALGAFACGLAAFSALSSTWHWVA